MLGRIVEEIDSIYLSRDNAVARRKVINGDPRAYSNMVADTRAFPIRDAMLARPAQPGAFPRAKLTASEVNAARLRWAMGERPTWPASTASRARA